MNIFRIVTFFLGRQAAELYQVALDLYEAGEAQLINTYRLLVLAIVVPVAVLALGFLLGLGGYHGGVEALETIAYWLVMVGLVLGPIGMAVFWVKLAVYGNAAWITSIIGNHLKDGFPVLDKMQLESFLKWFRSLTAWHVAVCLLLTLLHLADPIWRHPALMLIIALVVMALAAIASSAWFQTNLGRKVYAGGVAVVLVGTLLFWISPGFASFAKRASDWALGKQEHAQLTAQHDATREELDKRLLESILSEQDTLRRRAVEVCHGQYCPGDAEKMSELQDKVNRLKNGTYWDTASTEPAKPKTVTATPDPVADPAPITASAQPKAKQRTGTPRSTTARRPSCSGNHCPKPNLGGVWSELDQFPDIK
jgi:hypothetical protein